MKNGSNERMNYMNYYISRSLVLFFAFLIAPFAVSAQTADEMAKQLEDLYSKGEGTAITFSLDGEKIALTFASGSPKFRIDNPTDLIVSDGTTIWHYGKRKKEVVIDNANGKSGSLSNVEELIKFSTNYSAVLTSKKKTHEISLTPSKNVSNILDNIGGISLLKFTFTKSAKSGIQVSKVTARSGKGDISVGNIKIRTLKKIDPSLFTFTVPKGGTTIDLRD